MDDDLRAVATLLAAPEPTTDAIDRSRQQLRNRILRPARRRHTTWWSVGVGVTAAAAVSAIVISSVATTPATPHQGARDPSPSARAQGSSARQVLLAAATGAEHTPATHGTYWHVRTDILDDKGHLTHHSDTWTTRDGNESWRRDDATTGDRLVRQHTPVRYGLAAHPMTATQVERLPTDPAKLTAWMEYAAAHSDVRTPEGKLNKYMQRLAVVTSLVALVSGLPAPPKVRAAAFRALATWPGVRSFDPADGGLGVLIPINLGGLEDGRMVIDPDTGQVRDTDFFSSGNGSVSLVVPNHTATIVGEWTDIPPK